MGRFTILGIINTLREGMVVTVSPGGVGASMGAIAMCYPDALAGLVPHVATLGATPSRPPLLTSEVH